MLPGPVFSVELVASARRRRTFALRAAYGSILLLVLWQNYQVLTSWGTRAAAEVSVGEMASFALRVFWSFAITQGVAVALLTPAMLAGVIADEKQRRTLHYLMASRLNSAEIVLGKLAAGLLNLAVYVALGLPIVSLLTLFGGIPPELILHTYALTASGVVFLAGLSILVSTYARTVREATVVAFLLVAAWLILPMLLADPLEDTWPTVHAWVDPINEWILSTSPFALIVAADIYPPGTSTGRMVAWTAGLQVSWGVFWTALAVWRLRPVFRSQAGHAGRPGPWWRRLGRPWRLRPRPAVGAEPVLWKELHVDRSGGLVRWVTRILSLIGLLVLGYWCLGYALVAASEAWGGARPATPYGSAIGSFNGFLRTVTGALFVLWSLGVAVNAAASVTTEKEQETWVSLISTPLHGAEVMVPKLLGAIWSMRSLAAVLLVFWSLGVATTAVHPLGFLAVLSESAVFTAFAAALGVFISLHASRTTPATVATVAILILLNGGYLLCCLPMSVGTVLMASGCTPFVVAVSLFSFEDLWRLLDATPGRYYPDRWAAEVVMACLVSTVVYLVAAVVLIRWSIDWFDLAADRPRREGIPDITAAVEPVADGGRTRP